MSQIAKLTSVDTYYEDHRPGGDLSPSEPVLLLHGNPDSARLWRGVVDRLSPPYRCLTPDLPGFGRSAAAPSFDCSLEAMVRWVDELLGAAGVDGQVHLVVHDFGGPYGLAWAVRNPERVRTIAATNTLFFEQYRWHAWGRIWRTPILGEISSLLMNRWLFDRELRRGSRRLHRDHLDATWEFVTPATKRMVLRLYRATDPSVFAGWEEPLRDLMGRVPSRAFWGVHDPYIAPEWAHRLGAQKVVLFDDCGHWLPAEDPAGLADGLLELFVEARGGKA
ncbi:MAG: alpha/beta fold hydrolase [Acidobacteriota bacterium]